MICCGLTFCCFIKICLDCTNIEIENSVIAFFYIKKSQQLLTVKWKDDCFSLKEMTKNTCKAFFFGTMA